MARTWTIGVLVPSVTNPMYADVIAGAEGRAQELGYGVVFRTHVEGEREETVHPPAAPGPRRRPDCGERAAARRLHAPHRRRDESGPVVLVNRRVNRVKASVIVDDAAGAALAARHLLDNGHVDVVGLFGPPAIDTSRRRRNGYSRALRESGLETDRRRHAGLGLPQRLRRDPPDLRRSSGHDRGLRVDDGDGRRRHPRPARARACSVPEDVSLVALHDSELAGYLNPPLTTVSLPVRQMGSEAVDLLATSSRAANHVPSSSTASPN